MINSSSLGVALALLVYATVVIVPILLLAVRAEGGMAWLMGLMGANRRRAYSMGGAIGGAWLGLTAGLAGAMIVPVALLPMLAGAVLVLSALGAAIGYGRGAARSGRPEIRARVVAPRPRARRVA